MMGSARCPRTEPVAGSVALVWACRREAGHDGPCAAVPVTRTDMARTSAPGERCGELSPDGTPCAIPALAHLTTWGFLHSWQQCTALLVHGFPKTRCRLAPGHDGEHAVTWDRLGEHEGLEL